MATTFWSASNNIFMHMDDASGNLSMGSSNVTSSKLYVNGVIEGRSVLADFARLSHSSNVPTNANSSNMLLYFSSNTNSLMGIVGDVHSAK